jgi:hypothetical protein
VLDLVTVKEMLAEKKLILSPSIGTGTMPGLNLKRTVRDATELSADEKQQLTNAISLSVRRT